MGDNVVFPGLANIEPPLPGERHHAHECLGVHGRVLGADVVAIEFARQEVFDLRGDVDDQAGEGTAGLRDRRVPHQNAEAFRVVVDVIEQRHARLFQEGAGGARGERVGDGRQKIVHLAVDENRIQPFLAAEVLIDDGLGHTGFRRDLLDTDGLETFVREQGTSDIEQLLATLLAGHAHLGALARGGAVAALRSR